MSTVCTHLLPIPSVGLLIGPESILWQNGCFDLDAIWGDEWSWLTDGVLDGGGDRPRGRGTFWGKCGASHCKQLRLLQKCVN